MLRFLAILVALAGSSTARAQVVGDVIAGIAKPQSDELGPKLGARAGLVTSELGGLVGVDWIDARDGQAVDVNISRDRFRVLGHFVIPFVLDHDFAAHVRVGAGIELERVESMGTLFPGSTTRARDTGFAAEAAAGMFQAVGPVQIGGELGLALARHDEVDMIDAGTRWQVELLLAVRYAH